MPYPQGLSYDRDTRVVLVGTTVCQRDQTNLPPLPHVQRNIRHLAHLFTDSDIIGLPLESIVTIIDNEHASEALYKIVKAADEASDTLIVYYAGHGLLGDQTTPLYLVTKNTISAFKSFTGLRITDVKSAIRVSRARKRILILDCCYSGRAFEGGMGSTEDEVRAAIDVVGTYGIAAVPGDYKALAPEGAELTKFTQALVDVIEQGVRGAGQALTVDEVFDAVKRQLGREAMPLPQAINWNEGRNFKLAKNQHSKPPLRPSPPIDTSSAYDVAHDPATPLPSIDTSSAYDVARGLATPPEILAQLARHADSYIRQAVAGNEATPRKELVALADDEDSWVRCSVAENRAVPPETLVKLAEDAVSWVRLATGRNSATPAAALARLAQDLDADVRQASAENNATPPDTLVALVQDQVALVREAAAGNRGTPAKMLATLAQNRDLRMRRAVATNTGTPPEALDILARDSDGQVRRAIGNNSATPPEILARLAKDEVEDVRRAIARNRCTPPNEIAMLAGDLDIGVRMGIIANEATPTEIRAALSQDPDSGVREFARMKLRDRSRS